MESVKTKSITVTGDANTYYPVVITTTTSKSQPNYISVWKNLGSTTNSGYTGNHSNGTSSFWIMYELRSNVWDGNGGYCKTLYHCMNYATLCARAQLLGSGVGHMCLWLRGGTTSYEISCVGTAEPTVNIYYSTTNLGSSSYPVNVGPETAIGNKGIYNTAPLGYGDVHGNSLGASYVFDSGNSTKTYFNYSASGMSSTSWLGSWDGYTLKAITPYNAVKDVAIMKTGGGQAKHASGGEVDIGVQYGTSTSSSTYLYLYGNNSSGGRGLYDTNAGSVISFSGNSPIFNGVANKCLPLTGGTLSGDLTVNGNIFTVCESASHSAYVKAYNYAKTQSVSLMMGSGQVNRGVYDNTNDEWMIYRGAVSDNTYTSRTTRLKNGVAFENVYGTSAPGTTTYGYGVKGAVYFKLI